MPEDPANQAATATVELPRDSEARQRPSAVPFTSVTIVLGVWFALSHAGSG